MTASNRARDSRPPSPYFGLSRNPSVQRAGNVQIMQASQVSKIPANLPLRLHMICVSPIQNDPKSLKSSSFSPKKILIFLKITSQRHPKTMFPIFLEYPKSSTFRTPPRSGCTWRIKRKRLLGSPHHPWVLGSVVPGRASQAGPVANHQLSMDPCMVYIWYIYIYMLTFGGY